LETRKFAKGKTEDALPKTSQTKLEKKKKANNPRPSNETVIERGPLGKSQLMGEPADEGGRAGGRSAIVSRNNDDRGTEDKGGKVSENRI